MCCIESYFGKCKVHGVGSNIQYIGMDRELANWKWRAGINDFIFQLAKSNEFCVIDWHWSQLFYNLKEYL